LERRDEGAQARAVDEPHVLEIDDEPAIAVRDQIEERRPQLARDFDVDPRAHRRHHGYAVVFRDLNRHQPEKGFSKNPATRPAQRPASDASATTLWRVDAESSAEPRVPSRYAAKAAFGWPLARNSPQCRSASP